MPSIQFIIRQSVLNVIRLSFCFVSSLQFFSVCLSFVHIYYYLILFIFVQFSFKNDGYDFTVLFVVASSLLKRLSISFGTYFLSYQLLDSFWSFCFDRQFDSGE